MRKQIVRDGMFSAERLVIEPTDRGTEKARTALERRMRGWERCSTIAGQLDVYAEAAKRELDDFPEKIKKEIK